MELLADLLSYRRLRGAGGGGERGTVEGNEKHGTKVTRPRASRAHESVCAAASADVDASSTRERRAKRVIALQCEEKLPTALFNSQAGGARVRANRGFALRSSAAV